MSNKKRVVLTVLALALVCALSIAGTLAYLTKDTDKVENTFAAAGLVDAFTLDESPIKEQGDKGKVPNAQGVYELEVPTNRADRVQSNNYNQVVPGTNIPKDPEVYLKDLKFDSYLFLEVENTLPDTITYTPATGWNELTEVTGPNGGKMYYRVVNVSENNTNGEQIFKVINEDKLIVAGTYGDNNGETNGNLNFKAYLAQKEGFNTAAQAWTATFGAPAQP